MEEFSGRRSAAGIGFLRRGSSSSLRNQSHEDRANHYSNWPGGSGRLNAMKARQVNNQEKPRYGRSSFQSPSSRIPLGKLREERQRRVLLGEADIAESSSGRAAKADCLESSKRPVLGDDFNSDSQQTESEDALSVSTTDGSISMVPDSEVSDTPSSPGASTAPFESLCRDAPSSSRTRRQKDKELSLGRPETYAPSFIHRPTVPRNSTINAKSSNVLGSGAQRRGLKNLGCTSISDVVPPGCSSSDSVNNRRIEAMRKRAADGESSTRLRSLNASSSLGRAAPIYSSVPVPRIPAPEHSVSQQATRRTSRNLRETAVSVRTRRSSSRDTRIRMSEEREESMVPLHETVMRGQHVEQARFSMDEGLPGSLTRPFSVELPHAIYSSNRQGLNSRTVCSRSTSRPEESTPQMSHGLLGDRDGYRRINMEGIAEVLLALDRIEQDEELTYEQLLVLETNLLLGGLVFHDRHRDMRMDIDNMSYEELLALEEKMGTVSTGLSEEQFAKCLKRSIYRPAASLTTEANYVIADDIKCSICQEEYVEAEEVGRLGCEHQFHVCCIHHWLRQKNWCPICKTSAIPS